MAGFCLFLLVAFLPGYALGNLTDVLRFRTRTLAFQLAASVPLALAIGPIVAFTVGRWLSLTAVLGVNAGLSAYALYLLARAVKKSSFNSTDKKFPVFLGLIAIWLVIALVSLADIQIGRRLYFSTIAFDYAVRTEFTQAIATYGIPAQNPFTYPGHLVVLRYHYFWMIPCALVQRLGCGLVDARQAFIAGTLWCGMGLMSLIPLYLRVFSPQGATNLYRRSVIGIALLGVTGLDILGALLMWWLHYVGLVGGVSPSVEWWNNQVDGWVYTMLWEPHYTCALIACLTGFLVLWDVPQNSGLRRRIVSGLVAGMAFATAAGAGIYVAMVFAVFLALWTLLTLAQRWYRDTGMFVVAGVTAVAFTIPYLRTLTSTKAGGGGGQLFHLTVRSFDLVELLLKIFGFDRPWQILVGDLLTLPLNYFLELGVFFVAGWITWTRFRRRGRPATRYELAAFAMAATSIVICTFVKSSVITNNDLGWRGFLIAQFVLLLWAAELLSIPAAIPDASKSLLHLLLIVGAAGVVCDLASLRFFPVLSDAGVVPKIAWMTADRKLGERTYANREAYEWLRARTSPRAIVQQSPNVAYQETFWGLYGQRQTVAADRACGTGFGGDSDECAPTYARLDQLFSHGTSESFAAACRALPVDFFIAKDTDPVWHDRSSWVWNRPAIFENDFVRLFPCQPGPVSTKLDGSAPRAAGAVAQTVVSSGLRRQRGRNTDLRGTCKIRSAQAKPGCTLGPPPLQVQCLLWLGRRFRLPRL